MASELAGASRPRTHIVAELGITTRFVGEELHGRLDVVPQMHVPGTDALRTSILAVYADLLTGLLTTRVLAPRVPVTLDLSVQLLRPPVSCSEVCGEARVLKAGRSAIVAEVDFTADGEPLATAIGSFMASPDPSLVLPAIQDTVAQHTGPGERLSVPYAERAGCRRTSAGVATLPRTQDGLNASDTVNGGLIALAAEEAALSALRQKSWVSSLDLRYLRPARVGPFVAEAECWGEIARVHVRDTGKDNRVVVLATARLAVDEGSSLNGRSCAE